MNKSQLKSLIKECLIEMLTEGVSTNQKSVFENKSKNHLSEQKKNLDQKIKLEEERLRKHRESLDKLKFSENSVINDILSETAKTSFLEREKAERALKAGSIIPGIQNNPEAYDDEGAGVSIDFLDKFKNKNVDWSEIAGIK